MKRIVVVPPCEFFSIFNIIPSLKELTSWLGQVVCQRNSFEMAELRRREFADCLAMLIYRQG
jgi:hypothetical protein